VVWPKAHSLLDRADEVIE